MKNSSSVEIKNKEKSSVCMTRRKLLFVGAAVAMTSVILPSQASFAARKLNARKSKLPRLKIGSFSMLKEGVPMNFTYPRDEYGGSFIVKLGTPAGGGIGPSQDVVAFHGLCTHMGGAITGIYNHKHKVAGPCPFHLTTFDLTRFGMVVSGHATESLPQVILEVDGGDDIYATGFLSLLYGRNSNV